MLFKGNSSRLELLIGKIQAHKDPQSPSRDDKCNIKEKEALGTGSSSWHSEEGRPTSRKGEETPSSCATPTSTSFPSEPEVEADISQTVDGNNPAAPYPCQFCDRMFPRLSYLKKHEQSHGDQMPYRCSWCARLFKHKRSRDRHVKLHTGDRRYRCSHCEAAFSRSDHLKIHMKTHDTQKPFQCTSCSRGYNTAAALTSHMQSHKRHQNTQGSKLEMDFGRRSVSSHSTASPPIPNSPSPNLNLTLNHKSIKSQASASTTPILSPLKLTCMYCTRDSFTSMQQLQLHVHTMHQAILSGENLMPSPGQTAELSNHQKIDRNREVIFYAKKFPDDRNSLQEKDLYESSLTCGQCTMKFASPNLLREHLISIHRVDGLGSLMICPLCGIPCSSAAAYAEHYVLHHCEDRRLSEAREYGDPKLNGSYDIKQTRAKIAKDFEPADLTNKNLKPNENYSAGTLLCGQCGAALKDFESFREHLARHLKADQKNETPRNQCPKCEANFSDREEMMVHLTKHFLGQVTKEYACNACKKLYPHPDLLQRHLLDSHAHHLYRCALCRDTFDSRVAIQVHFAVKHSQECRIYRCNVCSINNENSPGNAPVENMNFFRSEAEMANHVRTVHAPPSHVNESPLPRSPASTPGITNRCVFCGICCNSDLDLQLHMASHSTNLYRCPICREGFAVEFLLDRHIAQVHHSNHTRENGRIHRPSRSQEDVNSETNREQRTKRGRSPASSNNNSLNQRDNNKRPNYGTVQQCELCERGEFTNDAELQAHKKLAHTPSKVQGKSMSSLSMTCAYCGEVCRSRSELESHTRIQHATNEHGGRHKCNICDEVCPSGATLAEHKLQKHCKIQLSDICIVCRGTLHSESQFFEHVQRHSLENVDPQQRLDSTLPHLPAPCVVCRQTLISDLEVRLHARHHLRSNSGSQNSESPSPKHNKSSTHNCCLCLREFNAEEFVSLPSNHSTNSANSLLFVCKACYMRHSQGLPILNYGHPRSKSELWLKETQWENASREKWNGNYKIEEKTSDVGTNDVMRCEECNIKFEDSDEAEKHRIEEHKPLGTYTCIQCQVSFPTEAKIQEHVKKEHLESSGKESLEALRCHLCLFDANSPLQLQSHLIEHTFAGCTALSCYICQSLFTAPIGLQNHMLQQHGLGARPYDCNNCELKFFFRAELDQHVGVFHSARVPSPKDVKKIENGIQEHDKEIHEKITVKEEIHQINENDEITVDVNEKYENQETNTINMENIHSDKVYTEQINDSES
ncbi:zinc finger protein 423 homolog isoform X2 [Leptopilina boulardi]|uniref:zinc finger protein 423 homolog isoform X2 n=1 Tax=Leptopilina boulardi TaxID=63433 RepID=UPI0021F5EEEB|nr:zinc finger protein 423 homolog isoform X2 [Leptopilina boulardi]